MAELPLVSICTPTYNRRHLFPLLIRCVELQDYPKDKIEWIIVNDGDEEIEDILNIAKKNKNLPEIKYYRYKNKIEDLGEKRNICNHYCSGDIIINMDDDDYYFPERISSCVELLINNNDVYCCGANITYHYFITHEGTIFINEGKSNNIVFTNTLAFKKELLNITSYGKNDNIKDFLLDYNLPVLLLDKDKTVVNIKHNNNYITTDSISLNNNTFIINENIEKYITDNECMNIIDNL